MSDETTEMQWSTCSRPTPADRFESAQGVVAWVTEQGGEARYELMGHIVNGFSQDDIPCIRIRTVDGWVYAAPGDTIVKGERWFYTWNESVPMIECYRGEFTVRRSS